MSNGPPFCGYIDDRYSLPNELLQIVFTHLANRRDRKTCGLVCYRWYEIVASCQWKHVSLTFTGRSEETIRDRRTCTESSSSRYGRVVSCSMIWTFFGAQENRRVASFVRSLSLLPHLGVHCKEPAKVLPADIFRILACFPNLRKVTLVDVNWVCPGNSDWINLTPPPPLEELRMEFKLYAKQFVKEELDVLLSPLALFKVKRVTVSGFTVSPIAEAAETAIQQVACNPEYLCIRGYEITELLLGILLLIRTPGHLSRLRSLEIGKLDQCIDRLSLTVGLTEELLRQAGHQIRHLTLYIGKGATNKDYVSLMPHCPNLTDLVICVETDIEGTAHDDHGERLVLEQSFLRGVHMCIQLQTVHFLVRIAAPIPGDDYTNGEAFSSIACTTCKANGDFQKQLEGLEDILLGVESLTTVAFAFYQETGVYDQWDTVPTFRTSEEMAKVKTLFPRLCSKGMLKAIPDEALDWDEHPDREGHLYPRPRLS